VDENVSAAAPDEGQQVPAKHEGPSTQPKLDEDPFNRSMDAGG
jgi:hypothetical protein